MYNTSAIERHNRSKSMRVSVVLHILLLLLAFFYALPSVDMEDLEEQPPYAVKVDFVFEESSMSKLAHDDSGVRREKAESAPQNEEQEETKEEVTEPQEIEPTKPQEIEITKPDIKMPTPVLIPPDDPISSPQLEEESPVKAQETPPTPTPKPTPPVVSPPKTTSTSGGKTSTTTGSTSGTNPSKPSSLPGSPGGTGKGDTGTGQGSSSGNDGDEGKANTSSGTGEYDGSGDGVFGRKVVYRDQQSAKAAVNETGFIAVKICVDRAGKVTYAELIPGLTTIKNKVTIKNYLKAARNYRVKADYSAPEEQCGKLNFKVDNLANNKLR